MFKRWLGKSKCDIYFLFYIFVAMSKNAHNGQMDNWDFAVFKYSREAYDSNEFMFPGYEELDGTIQGALNAGLQLY